MRVSGLSQRIGVLTSRLREPGLLIAVGLVVAVAAFHLWQSPANPPGFHRDEASIALNAQTLSQGLRDEHGALLPLYFVSFDDYKSPLHHYLLAAVFRLTGPQADVARSLSAVSILAAIFLLGLIAARRSGSPVVGVAAVLLAGATPWLFELGRYTLEVSTQPLLLCLLLLALDAGCRQARPHSVGAVAAGAALAGIVYGYAGGRLLGPLLAAALVAAGGRGRWRWLVTAWVTFAVALIPFVLYGLRHPGALTARYDATTFVRDGMSGTEIVWEAVSNYAQDVDLWHWVTSGDPRPYFVSWWPGALPAAVAVLALVGTALVLARYRNDPWWRYVLAAAFVVPIPAALTEDRYNELRLAALPTIMLVLTVPALALLIARARLEWPARLALAAVAVGAAAQLLYFVDVYRERGPSRTVIFEAPVQPLLEQGFGNATTIHVDFDDAYAQAHARWYAAEHGLPGTRVVVLPDGGIPPQGSVVFGRFQECDYACVQFARAGDYWLARAVDTRVP